MHQAKQQFLFIGFYVWYNSYVLVRSGKGHLESIMQERNSGFYFEAAYTWASYFQLKMRNSMSS